ncbi:mycofactocin system transcriptional regulator [Nesterenkonia haasae]|uniref:mycofactocin system transcriptional regulator n=1 Tax=Nesterenkonia haasae TaxID=2587813 RepID=UPI001391AC87|nr:mycofactocin system transcriptional regulator [Nesterenkonia haasae]NDK30213.1 mycofactocin system transcriptional regulator [Nesterenkonia haasae]
MKQAVAAVPNRRASRQAGRARLTSAESLGRTGLDLFIKYGFDNVTVEDISEAAGIGRRTFFRYFSSKNDLPWGDFDGLLLRMRSRLAEVPAETPLFDALRESVVDFNRFPEDEIPFLRQRMMVLLTTPTLVAHSALRYQDWRKVVAEFVAERLGVAWHSHIAITLGQVCLGISLSAYEEWLVDETLLLGELIDGGFHNVRAVFAG